MENFRKKYLEEKRIKNLNYKIEATQTINPLTGKAYLKSENPKVGILEDPIQAHLRAMEDRNPSANEHNQRLLKNLVDRLSLIDRALQYKRGELDISKVNSGQSKFLYDKYNINRLSLDDIIKITDHKDKGYMFIYEKNKIFELGYK